MFNLKKRQVAFSGALFVIVVLALILAVTLSAQGQSTDVPNQANLNPDDYKRQLILSHFQDDSRNVTLHVGSLHGTYFRCQGSNKGVYRIFRVTENYGQQQGIHSQVVRVTEFGTNNAYLIKIAKFGPYELAYNKQQGILECEIDPEAFVMKIIKGKRLQDITLPHPAKEPEAFVSFYRLAWDLMITLHQKHDILHGAFNADNIMVTLTADGAPLKMRAIDFGDAKPFSASVASLSAKIKSENRKWSAQRCHEHAITLYRAYEFINVNHFMTEKLFDVFLFSDLPPPEKPKVIEELRKKFQRMQEQAGNLLYYKSISENKQSSDGWYKVNYNF